LYPFRHAFAGHTPDQGDFDAARAALKESLAGARELGDRLGIAWALHGLGLAAFDEEDLPVARAFFEECLSLWRELEYPLGLVETIEWLGSTRRAQGDFVAAYALFEEMLAISREGNRSNYIARSISCLGTAAADLGRWEEAAANSATSLRMSRSGETIGDRAHIAWDLLGLARIALAEGRPARAARLLAATEPWWTACPIRWWRRELDQAASAVRAQMDAAAFEAAWAAGQAAPLEQIIAEALEEATAV
jgi:tetratricopeptide (TPR) repeat protein